MNWRDSISALPEGYCEVVYRKRKYGVTRTDFNCGRSLKVFARELGGTHFISFNYYFISAGGTLKPCEMPEQEVISFLENFERTDN